MNPKEEVQGKKPESWIRRADTVTILILTTVFAISVAIIVVKQSLAGRNVKIVHPEGGRQQYKIDMNAADAAELTLIPGIGPARAERIVEWRKAHGRIHSVEDIREAARISMKELEKMQGLITFNEPVQDVVEDSR